MRWGTQVLGVCLAGWAIATVVLLACGSSTSDPTAQGPDSSVASRSEGGGADPTPTGTSVGDLLPASGPEALAYATQFCQLLEPCCPRYGYGSDVAKCLKLFANTPATYLYDPTEGDACIAGMKDGIAQDPDFCRGPFTPSSCAEVFKTPGAGPPGSACQSREDCVSSPDGPVTCLVTTDGGLCQLMARGKPGEACNESDDTVLNPLPNPPAARLVSCKSADGLYCDSKSHVCAAQKPDGGACVFNNDCLNQEWCLGPTCVPQKVAGEPCGPNPAECADGFWCDGVAGQCAAKLADGVPCTNPVSCTHFCKAGTCKDVPVANITYLLYCDHD